MNVGASCGKIEVRARTKADTFYQFIVHIAYRLRFQFTLTFCKLALSTNPSMEASMIVTNG